MSAPTDPQANANADAGAGTPPSASTIAERMVVVRGIRLATAVNTISRTATRRAPLVILPAAGFAWGEYRTILEHFAAERRVAALDWPGFGASDHPAPGAFTYSAQGYAALLDTWLNAVGGTRVVLLGHGVGGSAALRFALAHPERVAGLVLVAPWGFQGRGAAQAILSVIMGTPWLLRHFEPALTSLVLGPANAATRAMLAARRAARAHEAVDLAPLTALWSANAVDVATLADTVGAISAPAMVLRGALDPLVSSGEAHRAAMAIGAHGALEVVLPEAGHLPFLQQSGAFLRAVSGLIETIEAG